MNQEQRLRAVFDYMFGPERCRVSLRDGEAGAATETNGDKSRVVADICFGFLAASKINPQSPG
jgi:hypothetical protein